MENIIKCNIVFNIQLKYLKYLKPSDGIWERTIFVPIFVKYKREHTIIIPYDTYMNRQSDTLRFS